MADLRRTDEAAGKFASSLPDGRWVRVENSGHNVQGDNPRGLLDAMTAFFRDAKNLLIPSRNRARAGAAKR